jgi:Right handed beta helix region
MVMMLCSLLLLFWTGATHAANFYVNPAGADTNSCLSSGLPCKTISGAVAKTQNPGDQILIQGGPAVHYDEEVVVSADNGNGATCNNTITTGCITITRDVASGANPTLMNCSTSSPQESSIELQMDYWRVYDLTFDSSSCPSGGKSSRWVVTVNADPAPNAPTGNIIDSNRINFWCGPNETTLVGNNPGCYPLHVKFAPGNVPVSSIANPRYPLNNIVKNNLLNHTKTTAIQIRTSRNTLVENNEIVNQRCGTPGATFASEIFLQSGIRIIGEGPGSDRAEDRGTILRYNYIHDFETPCIPAGLGASYSNLALWCDVGGLDGTMEGNALVDSRGITAAAEGFGIKIEAKCHNWKVHRNVLIDVGGVGIGTGNSSNGHHEGNDMTATNNTIVAIGLNGFSLLDGARSVLKNNIVDTRDGTGRIYLVLGGIAGKPLAFEDGETADGQHTINYNSIYDNVATSAQIAQEGGANLNLTQWRVAGFASHGYDKLGNEHNPLLVSRTTNSIASAQLQDGSPAIGAGEGGTDRGAFLAPRFDTAAVLAATPTRVDVTFDNISTLPLRFATSCAAVNWTVTGHTVSSCTVASDQVRLTVTPAFTIGEAARTVSYARNAGGGQKLTDSYPVGGRFYSEVFSFSAKPIANLVGETGGGGGGGVPIHTQSACQFEAVSGTEAAAPVLAGGTSLFLLAGQCARVRCAIDVTAAASASAGYGPRVSQNSGAYASVNNTCAAGGVCYNAAAFPDITNGANTSERLATPSTFVIGKIQLQSGSAPAIALTAGQGTELLTGVCVDAAAVVGTTYDLRWYRSGTVLDTYTVTPRITVGAAPTPGPGGGFRGGLSVTGGLIAH